MQTSTSLMSRVQWILFQTSRSLGDFPGIIRLVNIQPSSALNSQVPRTGIGSNVSIRGELELHTVAHDQVDDPERSVAQAEASKR
jgi:hypothetical protein